MKILLITIFFTSFLFSNTEQVVFVSSSSFSSQTAKLVQYEKINGKFKQISKPIIVNIGKKGLAWGIGNKAFQIKKDEPIKKEGDKKAVLGVFSLEKIYTYKNKIITKMPYETVNSKYICVDDSNSVFYNKIIKVKDKSKYKSYENMLLKSDVYEYVISVNHNKNAIKNRGSCIFLHVEDKKKKTTSGCTSMQKNKLINIIKWLDIKKEPILIQSTKSTCRRIKKQYPFLNCNL